MSRNQFKTRLVVITAVTEKKRTHNSLKNKQRKKKVALGEFLRAVSQSDHVWGGGHVFEMISAAIREKLQPFTSGMMYYFANAIKLRGEGNERLHGFDRHRRPWIWSRLFKKYCLK